MAVPHELKPLLLVVVVFLGDLLEAGPHLSNLDFAIESIFELLLDIVGLVESLEVDLDVVAVEELVDVEQLGLPTVTDLVDLLQVREVVHVVNDHHEWPQVHLICLRS